MAETWDPAKFDRDMQALMEAKLPISESKIKGLKNSAMSHPKQYQDFVRSIEQFLRNSSSDYKLAGMYVIDAIARSAHAIWRKKDDSEDGMTSKQILERFESMFNSIDPTAIFHSCSEKDKGKLIKTADIWGRGGIFSPKVVSYLSKGLSAVSSPKKDSRNIPKLDSQPAAPTNDATALLATLANIAKGQYPNAGTPTIPQQSEDVKEAPGNFDDFDYGDEDDDSSPKKTTASTGPELPAALANLLDTLKQNSSSVSHNNVPDNISHSVVPPSLDKPMPMGNIQTSKSPTDPNFTNSSYQAEDGPWSENSQAVGTSQYQNQVVPPPMAKTNTYGPPSNYQEPSRSPHSTIPRPPNPPVSLLDHPAKMNSIENKQDPEIRSFGNSLVFDDPTLPESSIRVLTRTLFVGPLPDTMTKQQIRDRFSEYGNVSSVVVHKTRNNMVNAFLKFDRRQALDHIKSTMNTFQLDKLIVKVNWASGFGPKMYFNYELGEAIVPLSAYTEIEKGYLKTGYYGGFQGSPFRDRVTIEEPDVEYRPPQALEPVGEQTATAAPKGPNFGRPPVTQGLKRELNSGNSPARGPKRQRDNDSNQPWPPVGMSQHMRPPPMVNTPNGPTAMLWPPPPPPGYQFPSAHGFRPAPNFSAKGMMNEKATKKY
ncbi:hypothetical protein BGW37DRAFT_517326 [Umbelopsis sp. PMI_123]|nr:hypothetical protein BGW37DRAFT_517326 [Umbelopsis sp. PMI_123]